MAGTIRLIQIAGISVFLHWSWFLVAVYEINSRGRYSSLTWNALEFVALFAIITLHEFGHALACRQVGGRADQIVLWPLGGVAYVTPPPRPGATLWSIVAGPLVNVVLIPVLGLLFLVFAFRVDSSLPQTDFMQFVGALNLMNIGLLIFNILPIYPLDGGKILWALLWFVLGRARSLMIAVMVGFVGVAGIALLAILGQSIWIGILAAFAGLQCYNGFRQAQALKRFEELPRREDFSCPSCKASPPRGAFWTCGACEAVFDTFESEAVCPNCNTHFPKTACANCGTFSAYSEWLSADRLVEAVEPGRSSFP